MDGIVDTDMGLDDQISLLYLAEISKQTGSNFNLKAVLTQGTDLAHAEAAKASAFSQKPVAPPSLRVAVFGDAGNSYTNGHTYSNREDSSYIGDSLCK